MTDSRDNVYAFVSHPSAREDGDGFPYTGKHAPKADMIDGGVKLRTLSIIIGPTANTWTFATLDYIGEHPLRPSSPDAVMARTMLT